MEDRDMSLEEMQEIRTEYLIKFNEIPMMVMSESEEHYCERLKKALERGRPITEEDIDEDFPLTDENGDPILY